MKDEICPIYLKLNPNDIVILKFIIESYEELAILRTLDADKGEVVIIALPDTLEETKKVLDSIIKNISFYYIDPPESLKNDWLLSEHMDLA